MINHIKDLRAEAGLSQTKLAELSGVSRRTINRIERGLAVDPEMDTLIRIAMGLGCRVEDAFEIEPFAACDRCGQSNYVRQLGSKKYCPKCRAELSLAVEKAAADIFGEPVSPDTLMRLFSR